MSQFSINIIQISPTDFGKPYQGVTGEAIEVKSHNRSIINLAKSFEGVVKDEDFDDGIVHLNVIGDLSLFIDQLTRAILDNIVNKEN